MVVSDISEMKFFTVQDGSGHFFLCSVFAHNFQEDGSVAVQDFIDSLGGINGDFIEFDMVHRLTGGRAENFVRSSLNGRFTQTAQTLVALL